jgi:hypothetical protein
MARTSVGEAGGAEGEVGADDASLAVAVGPPTAAGPTAGVDGVGGGAQAANMACAATRAMAACGAASGAR